jgi:hypothetical protein
LQALHLPRSEQPADDRDVFDGGDAHARSAGTGMRHHQVEAGKLRASSACSSDFIGGLLPAVRPPLSLPFQHDRQTVNHHIQETADAQADAGKT